MKNTLNEKLANNYLASLFYCMPGNFYWKDRKGRYLGCNNLLLKTLGFSSVDEIIGKTDFDLWPEQAEKILENDAEVLSKERPIYLEETVYHSSENMYFAVVKVPFIDQSGKVVGIIGNSLDITELKNTQSALREAKEKAESALKAKEQAELESREKSILLQTVLKEFKLDRYYLAGEYQGKYLTKREAECGYCLARGNTAKEIGNILHLSPRTVEGYLNSLREKLGAHTRSELISKLMACHFLDGVKPVF